MEKWTYRVVHIVPEMNAVTEENLNKLGEEGWELVAVSVVPHNLGGGSTTAYLKKRG